MEGQCAGHPTHSAVCTGRVLCPKVFLSTVPEILPLHVLWEALLECQCWGGWSWLPPQLMGAIS